MICKFNNYLSGSLVSRNILHFLENRFSTHAESNFKNNATFSLPGYYTFGLAWKKNCNLYLDNEFITGHYGGKNLKYMKMWFIRAGVEKFIQNRLALRFGLTTPMIMETSTLGDIRNLLPDPRFTISAGCGYKLRKFQFDLAVFFNPGQSYVQRKPVPALELSVGYVWR
ncbi:MAG TPA: hypothetical protein PLD62_09165 [Candidatus Cloacimonadota bacterium]|nr:hypothetical protein [Candidatus Cloacimonadota bacterium]